MERMIFVNLPTRDLTAADRFYETMGFTKNEAFSDEQASCWIVSPAIYVMVLSDGFFAGFLREGNTTNLGSGRVGALHALSVESVTELEQFFARAVEGGGKVYRAHSEPFPGMVEGAVTDPDGHIWEFSWMDPGIIPPDSSE